MQERRRVADPYKSREGLVFHHLEANPPPSAKQILAHLDIVLYERAGCVTLLDGSEPSEEMVRFARGLAIRNAGRPRERLGESLPRLLEDFKARADGSTGAIPTPWLGLNELLRGGLWPGVFVFGGLTGTGKTQLCLQIARHAAELGVPVGLVSLELGPHDLAARMLADAAGVSWSDLMVGAANDEDITAVEKILPAISNLSIYPEYGRATGWSVKNLQEIASELLSHANPDSPRFATKAMVVIDFLQLVGDENGDANSDMRGRIARAAYAAREIARREDVAVVLVSSVAREQYAKLAGNKVVPHVRDDGTLTAPHELVGAGKECGEIEYAADAVLVTFPWPEGIPETTETGGEGCREVIVAIPKLRYGPPGWTSLRFNGSRFSEPDPDRRHLRSSIKRLRKDLLDSNARRGRGGTSTRRGNTEADDRHRTFFKGEG